MRVWMHRLSGCLLHPSNLERNPWIRVNSEPVEESQKREILRSLCLLLLTAAESLCAFNGVRFDIPFLHAALKLSETTAAWLLKTTDMLEAARLCLFGPAHTFGLNLLCQHNQVAAGRAPRAAPQARRLPRVLRVLRRVLRLDEH